MVFTEKLREIQTPCYYYNIELLKKTLEKINTESGKYPAFHVHYAVKANANPVLLQIISSYGIGADCVSGNEIQRALECGFPADRLCRSREKRCGNRNRSAKRYLLFQQRISAGNPRHQ